MEGDRAADVSTRFDALRDHVLAADVHRGLGFVDIADLPPDDHAVPDERHIGWCPEHLDDGDPLGDRIDELGCREEREQRGAHWAIRATEDVLDVGDGGVRVMPAEREHPQSACVGDRRRERGRRDAPHPRLLQRQPAADERAEAVAHASPLSTRW